MKFATMNLFSFQEGKSAAQIYGEYIEQIQQAEELGFNRVWLAEHHFSRYGIVPSTLAMAAHLAGVTRTIRIGTAVIILPFWNPIAVAEEAAMADVLTGGRLDVGVGRGYQWLEFKSFGLNMEEARGRFNETLEILQRAWTQDTFSFHGEYFHFDDVEILPKPLQKPHPPIYVAGISPETLEWLAETGYSRLTGGTKTFKQLKRDQEQFAQMLQAKGKDPAGASAPILRLVYVTDHNDPEQLRRETELPLQWFYQTQQKVVTPPRWEDIPDQYAYYKTAFPKSVKVDWDYARENVVIFGDPDYVAERLRQVKDDLGTPEVIGFFNFGGLAHEKVQRSIELFGKHVIPALQADEARK